MTRARLTVLRAGPLTTVQDLGRAGWAHVGVTRSGAADRGALALANRLVGNAEHAPGLEVTLGGLSLRIEGHPVTLAVTGADCPLSLAGTPSPHRALLVAHPGDELTLARAGHGLRCYLAVRGGLDVVRQLGSSATDVLSGLGPAPLADGDELVVHDPTAVQDGGLVEGWPVTELAPEHPVPVRDVVVLSAVPGPREAVLAGGGLGELEHQTWRVSPDSDRVGVRLQGAVLPIDGGSGHLPSEPVVRGAVQVPPGGEPVLFLSDHPVTGGYPVVAVLTQASADLAAQLRPGDRVRIRLASRPGWADPPGDVPAADRDNS